HWLQLNIR
ncbi:Pyridoxine/pyridoxamine 5'-phosphate oxidase, partial [Haemophilus influenzae]